MLTISITTVYGQIVINVTKSGRIIVKDKIYNSMIYDTWVRREKSKKIEKIEKKRISKLNQPLKSKQKIKTNRWSQEVEDALNKELEDYFSKSTKSPDICDPIVDWSLTINAGQLLLEGRHADLQALYKDDAGIKRLMVTVSSTFGPLRPPSGCERRNNLWYC